MSWKIESRQAPAILNNQTVISEGTLKPRLVLPEWPANYYVSISSNQDPWWKKTFISYFYKPFSVNIEGVDEQIWVNRNSCCKRFDITKKELDETPDLFTPKLGLIIDQLNKFKQIKNPIAYCPPRKFSSIKVAAIFLRLLNHSMDRQIDLRIFKRDYPQLPASAHVTREGKIYIDFKPFYLGKGGCKKATIAYDLFIGELIARLVAKKDPIVEKGVEALNQFKGQGFAEVKSLIPFTNKRGKEKVAIFQPIYKQDLDTYLMHSKRGNNPATIKIAHQLIKAIAKIEERGIFGDLKPGNILLDEENNIYLTDFDFYLNHDETYKEARGTAEYISPEYINSEGKNNKKLDAWALGLVLYQLFYKGSLKWDDKIWPVCMRLIRTLKSDWLRELSFEPKHPIEPIIRALLKINPAERYSAREALELFEKMAPHFLKSTRL